MSDPGFLEAVRSMPLLQRALAAGALTGLCCASLSPLVVLRRMAFVGDGMAHAAFGGIGIGLYALAGSSYDDLSVQLVTLAFCLVLGVAIGKASRRADAEKLAEDSAIGIAFAVSMALGAFFIALRQQRDPQYVTSMDTYLFGSLLNIGDSDVLVLLALSVAVLGMLAAFQKELLFYTFDARLAEVSGIDVSFIHYLFILMLVLTVVVASRILGIILVSASLILPGVIALKLCTRLVPAMILAAAVGVLSFEAGLYLSYARPPIQPGAAVVLIQFALLIVAALLKAFGGVEKRTG